MLRKMVGSTARAFSDLAKVSGLRPLAHEGHNITSYGSYDIFHTEDKSMNIVAERILRVDTDSYKNRSELIKLCISDKEHKTTASLALYPLNNPKSHVTLEEGGKEYLFFLPNTNRDVQSNYASLFFKTNSKSPNKNLIASLAGQTALQKDIEEVLEKEGHKITKRSQGL